MSEPVKSAEGVNAKIGQVWGTLNQMLNDFIAALPNIVIAIVVVAIFWVLAKYARKLIRKATDNKNSANLGRVLGRIAQWAIILVGFLVALAVVAPSVQPADLLALLGVSGVAIGFAFKDILQNFLAGILILIREPYKIGDQIIFDGMEGTVEEIETRATLLTTYDGRRIVIPNGEIYTKSVTVNTAHPKRRSQYDVGIGYGDDIAKASKLMVEAMKGIEGVEADPAPEVLVVDLAGSSVNLRARWWSKPEQADVVHTSSRVIEAIKLAMDANYIDMPYPTQVLLFHDQTEETDGDRTAQREGWPKGENPPKPRTIAGSLKRVNSTSPEPSPDRPQA